MREQQIHDQCIKRNERNVQEADCTCQSISQIH